MKKGHILITPNKTIPRHRSARNLISQWKRENLTSPAHRSASLFYQITISPSIFISLCHVINGLKEFHVIDPQRTSPANRNVRTVSYINPTASSQIHSSNYQILNSNLLRIQILFLSKSSQNLSSKWTQAPKQQRREPVEGKEEDQGRSR
jgi:hypothetical protein